MNHLKTDSDQLTALKKSMTFWGRVIWLSVVALILSPIMTVFSFINTMPAALEHVKQEQPNGLVFVMQMVMYTLGFTIVGGLATLLALLVFVISLILLMNRGKRLQNLAEKLVSDQQR